MGRYVYTHGMEDFFVRGSQMPQRGVLVLPQAPAVAGVDPDLLRRIIREEIALLPRPMGGGVIERIVERAAPAERAVEPNRGEPFTGAGVQVDRLPEWVYPPASHEPFEYIGYVAVPALGGEANVVQFTVPDGRNGVIVRIANNFVGAGFNEGSGDILWRIEADGASFKNFEAIPASLGNPALPSTINSLRIFERQVITLVVRNVAIAAPGGALSGGRLGGWFYPRNEENEDIWA